MKGEMDRKSGGAVFFLSLFLRRSREPVESVRKQVLKVSRTVVGPLLPLPSFVSGAIGMSSDCSLAPLEVKAGGVWYFFYVA